MIDYSRVIPIPENAQTMKTGYVRLELSSKYNPEKKTTEHKYVSIGKMIDENTMHPNEKYYQFYPEEEVLDEPDPCHCDVQKVGAKLVADSVFSSLNLDSILENVFDTQTAQMIHDLACYMCLSQSSVMQHYPAWRFEHPGVDLDTNVSDCTVSRFFQTTITWRKVREFMDLWNKNRDKCTKVYLNYDSTNMGTEAKGIELAEYGYAKDDPSIPQVNLAVGADAATGIPLLYDLYEGSINDVSELSYSLRLAKQLGYSNLGFILDRGYLSQANISLLKEYGYDVLIMLKSNNACAQRSIRKCHDELKNGWNPSLYLEKNVYGMTVRDKLYADDKEDSCIHVFYDPRREVNEKQEFMELLKDWEEQLKEGISRKDLDERAGRKFARYFDLELSGGAVTGYQMNPENIREHLNMLGCFTICTTETMSAKEALSIYRGRDAVEKLFESIKREMGAKKLRVHETDSLNTKVFVLFIAAIIRSQIFFRLKDLKIEEKDKKRCTVPAMIRELDKIIAISDENYNYKRRRSLTPVQKKILKKFEIKETDIDRFIKNIN